MAEWDPWGVPEDYECKVIEDDTPIPKHVPHSTSLLLFLRSSSRHLMLSNPIPLCRVLLLHK